MPGDGEKSFWRIRRLLGVRDEQSAPDVDSVIRQELELRSLANGEVRMSRIREALRLPPAKDG